MFLFKKYSSAAFLLPKDSVTYFIRSLIFVNQRLASKHFLNDLLK